MPPQGLRLLAYLDDWLLLSSEQRKLLSETQTVLQLLEGLGWVLAVAKCQLQPLQRFPFLGANFDTVQNTVSPSEARASALARLAGRLQTLQALRARDMLRLLGHLASMIDIVPLTRLHMRGLQLCLLRQWRPKRDSMLAWITLD